MTIERLNIERLGIALSIDVTKLDKSRFVFGKNGAKYCDLTVWLSPDEPDDYGKHGGIQIAATKEEQEAKEKMPYVGNAKVFWAKKSQKDEWVGYFGENEKKPLSHSDEIEKVKNQTTEDWLSEYKAEANKQEQPFDDDIPF
tara:strand:+ start:632 stop:1057 length:426 start_codon:yes stop_codon:yes gene_type:complete